MDPARPITTPCCGHVYDEPNGYPVFWNPFNMVVQCHACGHVYVPEPRVGLGDALIAEIVKQRMFTVAHPDPDKSHTFVWNANAGEQLECVVTSHSNQP